jgi:predicted enzyme related to lactoylglutathione lyase
LQSIGEIVFNDNIIPFWQNNAITGTGRKTLTKNIVGSVERTADPLMIIKQKIFTLKNLNLYTMKRTTLTITLVVTSFLLGFAFNTIIFHTGKFTKMKKVTGIGGIFFKCKDPKAINEWYKTHLGFDTSPYGTSFEWREMDDSTKKGLTQWNPFVENTKYFEPSTKDFMINYRVDNLEALVEELRKENVTIVDKMETYDYGKFIHILDIEGNKIQLWEPKD